LTAAAFAPGRAGLQPAIFSGRQGWNPAFQTGFLSPLRGSESGTLKPTADAVGYSLPLLRSFFDAAFKRLICTAETSAQRGVLPSERELSQLAAATGAQTDS